MYNLKPNEAIIKSFAKRSNIPLAGLTLTPSFFSVVFSVPSNKCLIPQNINIETKEHEREPEKDPTVYTDTYGADLQPDWTYQMLHSQIMMWAESFYRRVNYTGDEINFYNPIIDISNMFENQLDVKSCSKLVHMLHRRHPMAYVVLKEFLEKSNKSSMEKFERLFRDYALFYQSVLDTTLGDIKSLFK